MKTKICNLVFILFAILLSNEAFADKQVTLSVKVQTAKRDGSGWDPGGGAPDLQICIWTPALNTCNYSRYPVCKNKFECAWKIWVPNGAFNLRVIDKDMADPDLVGNAKCAELAWPHSKKKCSVGGQIKSAVISK